MSHLRAQHETSEHAQAHDGVGARQSMWWRGVGEEGIG